MESNHSMSLGLLFSAIMVNGDFQDVYFPEF